MNNGALPLMVFQSDCNRVIHQVTQLLASKGFLVLESFNLQNAKAAAYSVCPCPHHGTDQCSCQMAVILVYAEDVDPVTLTIHGNDQQTELDIDNTPGNLSSRLLKNAIIDALGPINPFTFNYASVANLFF